MFQKKIVSFDKITDFKKYEGMPCVIRRNGNELGLFSHYLTNIGNIALAIDKKLIPVIDMKNTVNTWTSLMPEKEDNPWEYFFKQPLGKGLVDIDQQKFIEQANVPDSHKRPSDSMEFLTNDYAVDYWRKAAKKYMKLSDSAEQYAQEQYRKLVGGMRTVGVLCRGTDYVSLKPLGHPVQPSLEEVITKVHEVMEQYHCEAIYLATEDQAAEDLFKNEFGDKLLLQPCQRFHDEKNSYLFSIQKDMKCDVYQNALDYLASMYILSKCNCFIAGRTSGSVGAYIMSEGFEYCYFYNRGRYGIKDFVI